ncbi:MAG: hypothetical protein ABIG11_06565 [bacterium]
MRNLTPLLFVIMAFTLPLSMLSAQEAAPPQQATEADMPVEAPSADKIVSDISMPLRLSSRQEERIKSALKSLQKKFRRLDKDFKEASSEARKWRFRANDLRYEMLKLQKTIPDIVRPLLDPEQKERYDAMLAPAAPRTALPGFAPQQEDPAAVQPAKQAKPAAVKKKRRVRRRKKVPAVKKPANPAGEAAPVQIDSGPGLEEVPAGLMP